MSERESKRLVLGVSTLPDACGYNVFLSRSMDIVEPLFLLMRLSNPNSLSYILLLRPINPHAFLTAVARPLTFV